jgi:hypothetical protein
MGHLPGLSIPFLIAIFFVALIAYRVWHWPD